MNEKRAKQSLLNSIISSIIALFGGGLIYHIIQFHGVGISPDSVSYLATAKNIAAGKGITDYNNAPLILFPAGYPLFLSLFIKLSSFDLLIIAKVINAVLFTSLILFYGYIIECLSLKNTLWVYKLIILISLPISFSVLDIYTMLWSETLFCVLIPIFILSIHHYLNTPTKANLLITAFVTAFACDTRIAGISIIGTGIAIIALQNKFSIKKKIFDSILYLLISTSFILLNILRNNYLSGSMAGIRQKSETSLFANIHLVGDTILQWFQIPLTNEIGLIIGILIMSFLLFIAIMKVIQKNNSTIELIITVFTFFYFGFIILTSTLSKYEPINNRLLSPAYIPCLLSLTASLPKLIKNINGKLLRFLVIGFIAIIILIFDYRQMNYCANYFDEIKEAGIPGYTETDWQESDIVKFLQDKQQLKASGLDKKLPIYSNAADAVYFYSNLIVTNLPETAHTAQLSEYCGSGNDYIIWFNNEFDYKAIVRLEEVSLHRHLDTIKTFKDGYLLISKPFLR